MKSTKSKEKKWQCDDCYKSFKNKKALAEHLREEFEEYSQGLDTVCYQMEDLKIKP